MRRQAVIDNLVRQSMCQWYSGNKYMRNKYISKCNALCIIIAQVHILSVVHYQVPQYSQRAPGYFTRYSASAREFFSTKNKPIRLCLTTHTNIDRHTAHTTVSWPSPKQWVIVHTSDLMMILRQSVYFPLIITMEMGKLKTHRPTYVRPAKSYSSSTSTGFLKAELEHYSKHDFEVKFICLNGVSLPNSHQI